MPLYFFHIEDHQRYIDEDGVELADLTAARIEAVRVSSDMLRDHAKEFWQLGEWRVVVTDAHDKILFALSFESVDPATLPETFDRKRMTNLG